tara:strand:- start:44458 stop:45336 length:879 start_codon:yes stop_codon:yes gene_type:complete
MTEARPAVFIGSSSEGLRVAQIVQMHLQYTCDSTLWSQGVFGLGEGSLESLVNRLDDFDFAILIVTPDDLALSRDVVQQSPRDNVLLELGMFIGKLGRERTYFIYDRTANIKLPSDLAGITSATFQPHGSGDLQPALGPPCTQIELAIERLGKKEEVISADLRPSRGFQIIHSLLDPTVEQFIILMHEDGITIPRLPSWSDRGIAYQYLLGNHAGGMGSFVMDKMCLQFLDADIIQIDLRSMVSLTEHGHEFAVWLIENGHKATGFDTPIGGWGTRPLNLSREFFPTPPPAT